MMRNNIDPSNELTRDDFIDCDIEFTNDLNVLKKQNFYRSCTYPVDSHNVPDLTAVLRASKQSGKLLKKAIM
jgi:UDP-N-acetyl-D-galactosamine dehydrogenase